MRSNEIIPVHTRIYRHFGYAAFVSTITADQLVDAYRHYVEKSEARSLGHEEARQELEDFIDDGDLSGIDDDERPRIILVAASFGPGVTSTVLWLRRAFGVDVSCVQLVPYEIGGELLLGSSILIPLPEAADYEVKVAEKQQAASSERDKVFELGGGEVVYRFDSRRPVGSLCRCRCSRRLPARRYGSWFVAR